MAETVVDDFEAVEVEIERREPAADGIPFELVETAPEPFHEDGAVAKAGQRVEKCRDADRRGGNHLLSRIRQRSCNARRTPTGTPHRDTAAQKSPVGAVLVTDPVLVLKVIGRAGKMGLERLLERSEVVSMDTVHPFLGASGA